MNEFKVKNGIRTRRADIWVVATVAMITAAVASGSCFFGSATNVCESGRRCNPGQTCAVNQDICIEIGGCGDGVVSPDKLEACDDGNTLPGDGCSSDCTSNETCGNGKTDTIDSENPKETCDDGNTTSGDGCSANCLKETCGNGSYEPLNDEACDTAGDTQACNGNGLCTIPRCGDGYTNVEFTPFMAKAPEQCDKTETDETTTPPTIKSIDTSDCNGNNNGFEGPGSCRSASCGDGYTNKVFTPPGATESEQCDTEVDTDVCNGNNNGNNGPGSCRFSSCGDGYANTKFTPPGAISPEECDTGKDTQTCNGNGSGNSENNLESQCHQAKCGDRYVNTAFTPPEATTVEACDKGEIDSSDCNGNNNGANGPGSCQMPLCGDGYTNITFIPPGRSSPEQCDNGAANSDTDPNACRTNCVKAFCGDGVIDSPNEDCDPAKKPDDGCGASSTCNDCKCTP